MRFYPAPYTLPGISRYDANVILQDTITSAKFLTFCNNARLKLGARRSHALQRMVTAMRHTFPHR